MNSTLSEKRSIHISAGQVAFALAMIGLGILGLIKGDFTVMWQPVPRAVPAREALAYLITLVTLASGIGLLWRRTAAYAAGLLLAFFVIWLLVWRVRALFLASLIEGTWSFGETLVMIGTAWVLFAQFGRHWPRFHFVTGTKGLRIARICYGIGLIPFGYAHFANVQGTAVLVPGWLPWHVFWAYFTGATFIMAGVAIICGVFARLAAALSAVQMGLFSVLVWIPLMMRGSLNAFQWGEVVATFVLTTTGWVVADSYRGTSWFSKS